MLQRKITLYSIAVLVAFMVIWMVISYINSREVGNYYQVFEDRRELFDAVKDEVERIEKSKLGYKRDSGDIFLYRNGGNAAPNQFHDEVSKSLRANIEQINKLSGDKLDHLRYAESDGEVLIRFIFDWERAYGDTYHIMYGKNRDGVLKVYDDRDVNVELTELDKSWYGTRIR
jgi:hypothetical protein